jgi:4-amino-4-deoxy-L-arabinose transferase-like glycosyltransferase
VNQGTRHSNILDRVLDLLGEIFMSWNRYQQKIVWVIILLTAGIIVVNGITTEVSLGDESHHYRFAQNILLASKRVAFDPLYVSGNPPGFFYTSPPLWHFILAFLWKIIGGISQAVAQIYHVLFFVLLIWLTSVLAKEMMGEERRWVPALIIATVPMVVSFSTVFYMDVPMTALSTLSFYLILEKRYIEAGLASGLAFFTKLNSGFLFPGFLFVIVWNERRKFWGLLKNLVFFVFPILVVYIPDLYWRKQNINPKSDPLNVPHTLYRISKIVGGGRLKEYLISYTTNPTDLVKYFGLAFLCILFFHFFRLRQWDRKGAILWVPVISYLTLFFVFFGIGSDVRYLIPILPFLIVLATSSLPSLGKRWQIVMIGICLLQFGSTVFYVHQKRQISPEVKEGFEYVKKNVPEEALILYPEENLLIYGQRRIIWGAVQDYRPGKMGLYSIFWSSEDKEVDYLFKVNHIDYVLVKKSRIYDDHIEHHLGGYPQSFLERFSHSGKWITMFENPGVVLWKKVL